MQDCADCTDYGFHQGVGGIKYGPSLTDFVKKVRFHRDYQICYARVSFIVVVKFVSHV